MATGASYGTAVNKAKGIRGCGFILVDAAEFKVASIDQDDVQGRVIHQAYESKLRPTSLTDITVATPLFSGEHYFSLDATWSADPRIYVTSFNPAPLTVIGITPMVIGTDEPQD